MKQSKKAVRFKMVWLILGLIISTISFAQSDKQIDKAIKVFNKDYDKGISKLEKYMSKASPKRIKAWNTLVNMEYLRYERDKDLFSGLTISIQDRSKDSTDVENSDKDSTDTGDINTRDFLDILMNYPYDRLINLCRKATLVGESNEGDFRLRKLAIEVLDSDSSFSQKAKDYFEEAQDFYDKKDFELAIMNYKKVIKEEPNYYEAYIKLGTSFWEEEEIDSAIKYYNLAKPIQSSYVEPYSYITNLLINEELYFRAKKECIDAMCVHPGLDIKLKFYQILAQENKYMDEHRLLRDFYPNKIDKEQNELSGDLAPYREAKDEISKYCDKNGIIEPNGKTKDKYLEVYSWRRLIEEINEVPDVLKFAVEMEEEGYLDCYVLISLYHFDFYEQTKDFLSYEENREKVKTYINKYLIKDFDD